MNRPNLFSDFATNELAQDAVLAYILAWAAPNHKDKPELNALGEDMLRALLRETKIDADVGLENVQVATQDNRMDISVRINDTAFLIIEDKVHTGAHSDQILRYKTIAEEFKTESGEPWHPICAVYLKTGNECKGDHSKHADAFFFRADLLDVLGRHASIKNDIVVEFHQHLQKLHDNTESFLRKPFADWPWEAHQGYFGQLEDRIKADEQWWGYTANPAGGSLIFYWHKNAWRNQEDGWKPFLHIDHLAGFFIRVWREDGEKVYSDTLWNVLEKAESCAKNIAGINVKKPQRFGSGYAANAAQIYFDGDDLGSGSGYYIVTKGDGSINLDSTLARHEKAEELLVAMCK